MNFHSKRRIKCIKKYSNGTASEFKILNEIRDIGECIKSWQLYKLDRIDIFSFLLQNFMKLEIPKPSSRFTFVICHISFRWTVGNAKSFNVH